MGTSAVKKASEIACSADVSSLVIRPTLAFKIRATFVTRPSRDDELICPDASVDRAQCGGDRSAGEAGLAGGRTRYRFAARQRGRFPPQSCDLADRWAMFLSSFAAALDDQG